MLADPAWWQGYYEGNEDDQRLARRYSYSDRLRYYWPDPPSCPLPPTGCSATSRSTPIPLPLLSQHLPDQYRRVRADLLPLHPRALVVDHVRDVLRDYAFACGEEGRIA